MTLFRFYRLHRARGYSPLSSLRFAWQKVRHA